MTGYFERSPGNRSMMRLLAFIAVIVGSVVALSGVVLLFIVIEAMINGNTNVGTTIGSIILMIGGALSVIFGSEGIKAVQQRGEAKEPPQVL